MSSRIIASFTLSITAALILTGCATNTDVSEATLTEIENTAVAALEDPAAYASTSFTAVIAHSNALYAVAPETFTPVVDDLRDGGWIVVPGDIDLNAYGTRAEVPLTQANNPDSESVGTRMVLVQQGGEWKLQDILEYYVGEDMSLSDTVEAMYTSIPTAENHTQE